jgi:LemA protein
MQGRELEDTFVQIATIWRTALAAVAAFSLAGCGINSVPAAEEEAKAKWADVQSAYQRRADLIPNLVSTAEAAAISERDILTNVTEARSRAMGITIDTEDLSDPAEFARFQEGQNQLTQALGQFRTVVEQYPQLQSNQRFADLMVSLEGTENRIDNARTKYNEAVRQYNTTIRTFPDTIGANIIHGAEPMQPFNAQPGSEVAPDVEFNMGGT